MRILRMEDKADLKTFEFALDVDFSTKRRSVWKRES
jgi:hypothetical protein